MPTGTSLRFGVFVADLEATVDVPTRGLDPDCHDLRTTGRSGDDGGLDG